LPKLTYETGTGWIPAYRSVSGKHLQALPQAPNGMRIDEEGPGLGIPPPVYLVVGEQIVVRAGEPILQCSIIFARIPGGNRDIPEDGGMGEVELGLGDHLRGRENHTERKMQLQSKVRNCVSAYLRIHHTNCGFAAHIHLVSLRWRMIESHHNVVRVWEQGDAFAHKAGEINRK